MEKILRDNLPPELVDIICRETHRLNFKPCLNSIKNNLVWVRSNNKHSFMIDNKNYNSYLFLDEDWLTLQSKRFVRNHARAIKRHNANYYPDGYYYIRE